MSLHFVPVVLNLDCWATGQWSRYCWQKEKASSTTPKSIQWWSGLWATCREYICCWRRFECTRPNWFLSCLSLLAYLHGVGFKGDFWDILQEAEEKTGPPCSSATYKHGNIIRIWIENPLLSTKTVVIWYSGIVYSLQFMSQYPLV